MMPTKKSKKKMSAKISCPRENIKNDFLKLFLQNY